VLCSVLLAQTYVRAERPNGIDLTSYLLSARALAEGRSPYLLPTPFPYLYPATLAFLLIPFTFVPALAAVFVWFVLSVAAAVWSIRAVLLQTRPSLANRSAAVAVFLACFFTLFFTIAQSNLRNGQVNFIVLALCVAAGLAAAPRGAPAWSLAVAMKIFPLAWLPYFLLRRSWLWLAAAVGLIAVWCLLPAVVLGPRIVDIYEQYGRVFLVMSLEPRQQPLDFSLAGTIAWIARVPMTPVLKASAAAVVLGWILQADARRLRTTTNVRAFALYSLAIPLVSPQSEVHHLAFMLPAAAVVGAALWSDWPQAGRLLKIASVIAAALYLAATATPIASGPLFCASLIAFGVALLQTSDVVDH